MSTPPVEPDPQPCAQPDAPPTGATSVRDLPPPRTKEEFKAQLRAQVEANAAVAARRPVKPRRRAFPRALPWDSPLSRLWPGTKVLALLALTSLLLWVPRWPSLALVTLLLWLATRAARVPRSVIPDIPWWVWWGVLCGGIGAAIEGGVEYYVRTCVLGADLLWASLLLLLTTRPEHLAPAFASLLAPLRLLRLPVDEWARTMALSLRGLPVLAGELTTLSDASRLRGGWQRRIRGKRTVRSTYGALFREGGDMITAALSAADRRATATGRAMTLRGGVAQVRRERVRVGVVDGVAVLLTVGVVVASWWLRDLGR